MQDSVPVFISSNTANGKNLTGEEEPRRYKYHSDPLTKPFGYVTLYIGKDLVDDTRLQDLIRFSRTIGAIFMKQEKEKAEAFVVEQLGFAVEVTRLPNGARSVKLVNTQSKIWEASPAWAFSEVLDWISGARNLNRNQSLPQLCAKDLEHWTLDELIDVYSATVVLDIRPGGAVATLRDHIIKRLAYLPISAGEFQYLHERLPIEDIVLRKMVETFFLHGERRHYNSKDMRVEVDKLAKYVNACCHDEFKALVIEVRGKRHAAALEGVKGKAAGKKQTSNGKGKAAASKESDTQKEVAVKDVGAGAAAHASRGDSALESSPRSATKA